MKALTLLLLCLSVALYAQDEEGWRVVFEDDFSADDKGWHVNSATNNASRISKDKQRLVLELFDHGFKRATNYTPVDFNMDFIFKTEIGSQGEAKLNKRERSDFGVTIGYSSHRYKDVQGSYTFLLNHYQKGVRLISRTKNGRILYDTLLRGINYNPLKYNKIAIKKQDNQVSYSLNGKIIFQSRSVETAGGAITLFAIRKMKAYMDNLVIQQRPGSLKLPTEQYASIANRIGFNGRSAEFSDEGDEAMHELAELMSGNSDVLKVISHCDDVGDTKDLLSLTDLRARTVRSYLVALGIDASRIITEGKGDLHPITSNLSEKGSQVNNRIVLELVKKES